MDKILRISIVKTNCVSALSYIPIPRYITLKFKKRRDKISKRCLEILGPPTTVKMFHPSVLIEIFL